MCVPQAYDLMGMPQHATEARFDDWLSQAPNRYSPIAAVGPEPMRPDLTVIRDKMAPPPEVAEAREFRSRANARDFFLPGMRRVLGP